MRHFAQAGAVLAAGLIVAFTATATSVPRLSFEQLTDSSELVVTGQIGHSWAAWDNSHHFIWTHYELAVSSMEKGAATSSVTFSEPGGVVGGIGQTIAGTVQYAAGERVVVFLQRMPNGYLRTTGWSQGKFTVDSSGHVHGGASLAGLDLVEAGSAPAARAVPVEGITAVELSARVIARVRSQQGRLQGGTK